MQVSAFSQCLLRESPGYSKRSQLVAKGRTQIFHTARCWRCESADNIDSYAMFVPVLDIAELLAWLGIQVFRWAFTPLLVIVCFQALRRRRAKRRVVTSVQPETMSAPKAAAR
jgi:hypothetical protein